MVNITDRGREGRKGGGNDLRDQGVIGSDTARNPLPKSSNLEWGEGAGLEDRTWDHLPVLLPVWSREEVSEPDVFFLLFPQIRPKEDRSALIRLCRGVLSVGTPVPAEEGGQVASLHPADVRHPHTVRLGLLIRQLSACETVLGRGGGKAGESASAHTESSRNTSTLALKPRGFLGLLPGISGPPCGHRTPSACTPLGGCKRWRDVNKYHTKDKNAFQRAIKNSCPALHWRKKITLRLAI